MSASTDYIDAFSIEHDGPITLIEVAPSLERLDPSLIEGAAGMLLEPLRHQEAPRVVVDLGRIDYFGSPFLALLIRCWKLASVRGGVLVLAGASARAREQLRITSLDVVWPIFASRREALASLGAG